VPRVPNGWAIATGTGVEEVGSAETAAATGNSAMIRNPADIAALRIARMLTFTPVNSFVPFPSIRQRLSHQTMVQAVCHEKYGGFSSRAPRSTCYMTIICRRGTKNFSRRRLAMVEVESAACVITWQRGVGPRLDLDRFAVRLAPVHG
jgi:hypothetical protein